MKAILLILLVSFTLNAQNAPQLIYYYNGQAYHRNGTGEIGSDSTFSVPATVDTATIVASKNWTTNQFQAKGTGGSTDSTVYATIYRLQQTIDSLVQLKNMRQAQELANAGATTLSTIGFAAASTKTGTVTSADDANGIFQKHRTTSASGNSAGWLSAFTLTKLDWLPRFAARVQLDTGAITNSRYWIGLFSASPVASGVPNIHAMAFRYDTGVDGTAFWRCVTIAGTGASANVTTTTVATAINTAYDLYIFPNSTSKVSFYINNVLVAVHTSTLPTSSTLLGYGCQVTTLTAGPHNIRVSRISLQQK